MTLQSRLILDNLNRKIEDMRDYQVSQDDLMRHDLDGMKSQLKLLETELRRKT